MVGVGVCGGGETDAEKAGWAENRGALLGVAAGCWRLPSITVCQQELWQW